MIRQMDQWLATYANITREKYPNADLTTLAPEPPVDSVSPSFPTQMPSSSPASRSSWKKPDWNPASKMLTSLSPVKAASMARPSWAKPHCVAAIAKKYNKTVLAFSGCTTKEATLCNQHGIDAFFPILHTITTLEEAMHPETTPPKPDRHRRTGLPPDPGSTDTLNITLVHSSHIHN